MTNRLSLLLLLIALSISLTLLSCKDDKDEAQPEIISAAGDITAAMDEFNFNKPQETE